MAWTIQGNIKGATGSQGPKGDPGDPGPKGDTGDTGAAGPAGAGISIQGEVATYADLPDNLTSGDAGKAYEVLADGHLYVWTGTQFPADGFGTEFRGPQGIQGVKGDTGDTGATGSPGSPGARGSKWFTGAGSPSGVGGSVAGDFYLDTSTGDVYELS